MTSGITLRTPTRRARGRSGYGTGGGSLNRTEAPTRRRPPPAGRGYHPRKLGLRRRVILTAPERAVGSLLKREGYSCPFVQSAAADRGRESRETSDARVEPITKKRRNAADENPEDAPGECRRLRLFVPGRGGCRLLAELSWPRPGPCPPSELARSWPASSASGRRSGEIARIGPLSKQTGSRLSTGNRGSLDRLSTSTEQPRPAEL